MLESACDSTARSVAGGANAPPASARSAGSTNSRNDTSVLTGFPGSPKTSVRPLAVFANAKPQRLARLHPHLVELLRTPSSASTPGTRSFTPAETPPETSSTSHSSPRAIFSRRSAGSSRPTPRSTGVAFAAASAANSIGPLLLRICPGPTRLVGGDQFVARRQHADARPRIGADFGLPDLGQQRDVERPEQLARLQHDLPGVKRRAASQNARARLHRRGRIADRAVGEHARSLPTSRPRRRPPAVGAPVMMRIVVPGRTAWLGTPPAVTSSSSRSVSRRVARGDGVAIDLRLIERRRIDVADDVLGEAQAEQLAKPQALRRQRTDAAGDSLVSFSNG